MTVPLTLVKTMLHVLMVSIIAPVTVLQNFMAMIVRNCVTLVILTPVVTVGIVPSLETLIIAPVLRDLRV